MQYCNSCGPHRTPFGCAEIKGKISIPYIHAACLLCLDLNSSFLAAVFDMQSFSICWRKFKTWTWSQNTNICFSDDTSRQVCKTKNCGIINSIYSFICIRSCVCILRWDFKVLTKRLLQYLWSYLGSVSSNSILNYFTKLLNNVDQLGGVSWRQIMVNVEDIKA